MFRVNGDIQTEDAATHMTCPECHGAGYLYRVNIVARTATPEPCESCGGCGIAHCCDGHVASPDCWCDPVEESPGVWVHIDRTLH